MNKSRFFSFLVCAVLVAGFSTTGFAQATRTWVSGVGDDANPCSRTAPCKTFAGAISKTFINGEINALDPGGFGTVTITKSISIDAHEIFASILASGTNGIIINFAAANANDPLRIVRLRNLNLNGAGASGSVGTRTGLNGIRIIGGGVGADTVDIEDCLVTDFTQRGISDERSTGGKLMVGNTLIRNNGGAGIGMFPSSGSVRIDAVLDRVNCYKNAVGAGFGGSAVAMIVNSVFSLNTNSGIETDPPSAVANIDNSTMSGNGTGVTVVGGICRLSNSNIAFNNTGITGTTQSHTNNRIAGNTSAGTAPTPIGVTTNPTGQQ
jgi:hypothetical protein